MRITATVAALVLVALGVAGAIVYLIEAERLEQQTVDAVDQELDEFAQFTATRGTSYPDVGTMLEGFMTSSVPTTTSCWCSWVGDSPRKKSPPTTSCPRTRRSRRPPRPLVLDGGSTRLDTADGEVLITAQPVAVAGETGALVAVRLAEGRAGLHDTMRTYAIVAALSLLLVTADRVLAGPGGCSHRCAPCARRPRRSPRPTCPGGSRSPATTTSPR